MNISVITYIINNCYSKKYIRYIQCIPSQHKKKLFIRDVTYTDLTAVTKGRKRPILGVKHMKNRSILLGISFLCVGILVMPFTVSLFADQHTWVDGASVDCTATCHTDIVEPVAATMHFSLVGAGGSEYCAECHQITAVATTDGTTGGGLYDDEHVAVTVECLDCHAQASAVGDVWYDGVGDDGVASKAFINNATEAHSPFVGTLASPAGAWTATLLAGNNEACIACHTGITVVPDLTYGADTMYVNGTEDASGTWTVTFEATGP
jgi:nitrate/TMAO reductase-like tetraheme cytochrome c subunit